MIKHAIATVSIALSLAVAVAPATAGAAPAKSQPKAKRFDKRMQHNMFPMRCAARRADC